MSGNFRGLLSKLRFAGPSEPLSATPANEPDLDLATAPLSTTTRSVDDDRLRIKRALLADQVNVAATILARLAKSDELDLAEIEAFSREVSESLSNDVEFDFILEIASRKSIPPRVKRGFLKAFSSRPRSAAEGLSVLAVVSGGKLGAIPIHSYLLPLMRSVEPASEQEEEFLLRLLEIVADNEKLRASVLNAFLQPRQIAPDWLVAITRHDDLLSPASTLKLVSSLKTQKMHESALSFLKSAIGRHPGHGLLLQQRLSLEIQLSPKDDVADALASQVRATSFQEYLTRIYGEFGNLVPSVTHEDNARLFPDKITAGSKRQAEVYAAFAGLIVAQLRQLKVLRFGEERQTTALSDWGVANYTSAQAVAEPAINAAFFMLHAALHEDPACSEALTQLASLHELREDAPRRLEVLERAIKLGGAGQALKASWLAVLCDVGELAKAQAAAQSLHSDAEIGMAAFVPPRDFSPVVRTTDLIEQKDGASVFTAVNRYETRSVKQPVAYEPLAVHHLSDVTLLGNTCLLGEAGDALAYDSYVASVPAGGVFLGRGKAGLVYTRPEQIERLGEPSIYFIGLKSHFNNFYHALIQNFSRIALLSKEDLLKGRRFILPVATPPWALRLFRLLGVRDEDLFPVDPERLYRFDDLIIPTPARMTSLPPLEALAATRAALGVGEAPAKAGGRRIFWSRQLGTAMRRPLINEIELLELAQARGYEILDPAAFTPREQIDMLSETSVVAGATGAAFVNLLFAPPDINAVCIAPRQSAKNYYPALASCLGQNFTWLLGEYLPEGRHGKGYPQLPYSIDLDTFQRGLDLAEKNVDIS